VRLGAAKAELRGRLAAIYADLDARLAAIGAVCLGGGACCRFDLSGERLYLSTVELAMLLQSPPPPEHRNPARCPYLAGPRCLARERRPLGCRTFFCDRQAGQSARDLYEQFHKRIRELHEEYSIQYFYVNIIEGIEQIANCEMRIANFLFR